MNENVIIDNLLVDAVAKEVLRKVSRIANSDDEFIRKNIPALLIVSESGCGVTSYGEAYGKIIEDSPVLQIKGMKNFIELVFPKDNQQDENRFFASPQIVASVRNRFYGTFLISFSEYSGVDLIRSSSFQRLLEYIEMNRENIRFLFHVLPSFNAKKQLIAKISEIINIFDISLDKPSVDIAFDYMLVEMKRLGFVINVDCAKKLKVKLLSKVVNTDMYLGYKTLNNIIRKISYELAVCASDSQSILNEDVIDKLICEYEAVKYDSDSKIGFRM